MSIEQNTPTPAATVECPNCMDSHLTASGYCQNCEFQASTESVAHGGNDHANDLRNLIYCALQFDHRGETDLKHEELMALVKRDWLTEGEENNELYVTDAGTAVMALALREPVASVEAVACWRYLNQLGEVVSEWIDGAPPAKLFDLCGNELIGCTVEVAYNAKPAEHVVDDSAVASFVERAASVICGKSFPTGSALAKAREICALALSMLTPAERPVEAWQPMESAPRDGSMLRLLVQFEDHATEDTAGPAPTIGAYCEGAECWQFAGWCWTHDHFTEGKGTPVGWLPMITADQEAQA